MILFKKIILIKIVSCAFLVISFNYVFADETKLKELQKAQISAMNQYFDQVKQIKNPSAEDLARLRGSILESVRLKSVTSMEGMNAKTRTDTAKELDLQFQDFLKKFRKRIETDSDFVKNPKLQQAARGALKDALRGDHSKLKLKLPKKDSGQAERKGLKLDDTSVPESPALDGSKVPKEIEFKPKTQSIKPVNGQGSKN